MCRLIRSVNEVGVLIPEIVAAHAMNPPIGLLVELVLGAHVERGGSPRGAV